MKTFADRLIYLRTIKMITQYDLSLIIGVGSNTVSRWENAGKIPRPIHMKKLVEYFEVDSEWLQFGKTKAKK